MVTKKMPEELRKMADAGGLLQRLHDHLTGIVAPGVTTQQLEDAAQGFIADHGARPSFAGPVEEGCGGFSTALCSSVGDTVVDGVPDDRALVAGDLLSIDAGTELAGLHSDAGVLTAPLAEIEERLSA